MKRDYLLTGSNWLRNFELQTFAKWWRFCLPPLPLVIALWHWYTGDPNGAKINSWRMAANSSAWIVLISTWPYIKKITETAAPFDARLRNLRTQKLAA
jgi:hypothetical protein